MFCKLSSAVVPVFAGVVPEKILHVPKNRSMLDRVGWLARHNAVYVVGLPMVPLYPSDFDGQFVLSVNGATLPGGTRHDLSTVEMSVAEHLGVCKVFEASGRCIGALLGTPIDLGSGTVLQERYDIPADLDADPDAFVETWIYALTGFFIFVLDTPGARRVYLDACGALSVVYDPETGAVGSTAPALMSEAECARRFQSDLHEAFDVANIGWFSGTLTAHRGIRRLLPNHFLDLDGLDTVRHWPRGAIAVTDTPEVACADILDASTQTIRALLRSGAVAQALTAGNETRMMLAAARDMKDEIEFVTVSAAVAALDLHRAKELSARFGLPHRIIPLRFATDAQADDWQARTGQCVTGPHARTHPTVDALRTRPYFVGGLGGEIGRAFFWRPDDTNQTEVTPELLWTRMGFAPHPLGLSEMADWLESVKGLPALLQLDLAYIELRMGSWGFCLSYCTPQPVDIHPLISRRNFASMLSLPPEWRRQANGTNRMIQEVVRAGWPEALELPIGRFGDYRDVTFRLWQVLQDPAAIPRKLRKRFL